MLISTWKRFKPTTGLKHHLLCKPEHFSSVMLLLFQEMKDMKSVLRKGTLNGYLIPMLKRTQKRINYLREDAEDLVDANVQSGVTPSRVDVNMRDLVPVRPPQKIILKLA